MGNSFIALDVETANADMASICQVGIVAFEDGRETNSWKTLVNPRDEFDWMNISIHGIDEKAVRGAPTYPEIADHLRELLSGRIVVHHMPFDRVAIGRAQECHGLRRVDCTWLDTARVTRRAWPQFSKRGYGLAAIAAFCRIEFKHHDAEEDARAAGLVLLKAMENTGLEPEAWVDQA